MGKNQRMAAALLAAILACTSAPPAGAIQGPQLLDFGPWNGLVVCESGGNAAAQSGHGDYGLFQFRQPTWNNVARSAGRTDLVGRQPHTVAVQDQYAMAVQLRDMPGGGIGHWSCGWRYGDGTGPVTVANDPATTGAVVPAPVPVPAPAPQPAPVPEPEPTPVFEVLLPFGQESTYEQPPSRNPDGRPW